jgi:hypothetical protein
LLLQAIAYSHCVAASKLIIFLIECKSTNGSKIKERPTQTAFCLQGSYSSATKLMRTFASIFPVRELKGVWMMVFVLFRQWKVSFCLDFAAWKPIIVPIECKSTCRH